MSIEGIDPELLARLTPEQQALAKSAEAFCRELDCGDSVRILLQAAVEIERNPYKVASALRGLAAIAEVDLGRVRS